LGGADCEQAGEVHSVGAAQGVLAGELSGVSVTTSVSSTVRVDAHSPPGVLGPTLIAGIQTMSTAGGGQRCAHLGIGESAGHRGIASVPQDSSNVAASSSTSS